MAVAFANLRSRLILAFLGVTLLPLGTLVVVNHITFSRVLTLNAQRNLAATARQTAAQLDRFINESLTTVRVEAILPEIVRYVQDPQAAYYETAILTLLSLSRRDSINVLSYGLVNRRGENILDTYTPYIGRQEAERDYFQQAVLSGTPYVSTLRISDRGSPLREVYFSAPIRNARGEVIGVLRVAYNATIFDQVITRQTDVAGEGSFALLLDEAGVRLIQGQAPDRAFVPLLPLAEYDRWQLQQRYGQLADPPTQVNAALQEAIINRQAAVLTTTLDDWGSQRQLLSLEPLQSVPWSVLMVQPEATFLTPIRRQTQELLLLAVVIIGLVVGVAFGAGQLLASPITALTQILTNFNTRHAQRQELSTGDALTLNQDLIGQVETYAQQFRQQQPWLRFEEMGILTTTLESMAQQLQRSFQELVKANEQLEERVKDRTEDLHRAKNEIERLYQRLQVENVRLSTELEITRRLQKMILPREDELSGIPELEIAGFMEPAAEVGGDYYDVLPYGDRIRIGIGDVTGHGLESGVLMLMVQMAVRTLLANEEVDLARFLDTLNRAVYANVQRMRSDKNLSLTLLDYHRGRVRLVGQHEELVWRRHTGEVHRIDIQDLGFPVGLAADIRPWIQEHELELMAGDMLILYSDGVTEAMDGNHGLYGVERLCQVVATPELTSAKAMRDAIIRDVYAHIGKQKVYDDITLLVLRQR
ncbi:MAG: hypothetical protein OHK0012_03070 [Synechococcales cyanobacterium]